MTKRKDFRVGDRVRVFLSLRDGIAVRNASVEKPGQVDSEMGEPGVYVCLDDPIQVYDCDGDIEDVSRIWVHRKQCHRLKKKEKPKVERLERWVAVYKTGDVDAFGFKDKDHAVDFFKCLEDEGGIHNELDRIVGLFEVNSGEAIVSKESLTEAWKRNVLASDGRGWDERFSEFCQALGLEERWACASGL